VVIGANSVARGNIPSYAVAVGIPAVVVADRTTRYAADAARRAYLAGLAEANARTTARLHTGAPPPPETVQPEPVRPEPVRPETMRPETGPGETGSDGVRAPGEDMAGGEGFSSYSPVRHYVPHERLDVPPDRSIVGEETQRG
jgi:hypothetical protein